MMISREVFDTRPNVVCDVLRLNKRVYYYYLFFRLVNSFRDLSLGDPIFGSE